MFNTELISLSCPGVYIIVYNITHNSDNWHDAVQSDKEHFMFITVLKQIICLCVVVDFKLRLVCVSYNVQILKRCTWVLSYCYKRDRKSKRTPQQTRHSLNIKRMKYYITNQHHYFMSDCSLCLKHFKYFKTTRLTDCLNKNNYLDEVCQCLSVGLNQLDQNITSSLTLEETLINYLLILTFRRLLFKCLHVAPWLLKPFVFYVKHFERCHTKLNTLDTQTMNF